MQSSRLEVLKATYLRRLQEAVQKYPERYPWAYQETTTVYSNLGPVTGKTRTVEEVAENMIAAFQRGTANIDGPAWKATCKELGIKHTRKAIREWLQQPESVDYDMFIKE